LGDHRPGELVWSDLEPQALFDRLVCASGGNPCEDLIDHKNPEKAMALEHAPEWEQLSRNHLEGRTAAFFCYSDAGANEMDPSGRPKKLRHKGWFTPDQEPFAEMRQAYAPLVWQCRFSGIEVPDQLWTHAVTGVGLPYSDNQAEDMIREDESSPPLMRGRIASALTWCRRGRSSQGSIGPLDTRLQATRGLI
jgi:hypothetical protein